MQERHDERIERTVATLEHVKQEHGNAEDMYVEMHKHLNCPHCGGSGHIDDVTKSWLQFKEFIEWANAQGYDCAHTCNSNTGEWIAFNPMTADLWKAWQAARSITDKGGSA